MQPVSETGGERAVITGGASLMILLLALVPAVAVGLLFDHFARAVSDAERRFNADGQE